MHDKVKSAAYGLMSLALLMAAAPGYPEGTCGGTMRGYDGRGYVCDPDRKPVCEQSSGRCVCLQRRECGAKQDDPW